MTLSRVYFQWSSPPSHQIVIHASKMCQVRSSIIIIIIIIILEGQLPKPSDTHLRWNYIICRVVNLGSR